METEKIKEILIQKGADSSLFDLPIFNEKIMRELSRMSDSDIESIEVKPDGTFNFLSTKIEKEQDENGDNITIISTKQSQNRKVWGTYFDYLMSGEPVPPYSVDCVDVELVRYINGEGIETKREMKEYGKLEETLTRGKGVIISTTDTRGEDEFWDPGFWSLDFDDYPATFGTIDGDKPSKAINTFDRNSKKVISKYPHLEATMNKRRKELLERIDERTLTLISDNLTLKSNNDKLQKMLSKAMEFAQTVRDSAVGKIFFGRKAKEVLGNQEKDTKSLSDGR